MQAATMVTSAGKTAPPVQIQITYAVFAVGVIFVFSHLAGGEFSAILTLSVMFQCLALILLALQVLLKNSAAGISAKALQLDAASFCFRLSSTLWLNGYLPVDMTGDHIYQACDIISLAVVGWLLYQLHSVHKDSYQATEDTMPTIPVVLASFILAMPLHADMNSRPLFDTTWMTGLFISAVAVLPQLWLMSKRGKCEALTSHYIAAMAVSRLLSGTFMWHARFDITCAPWVDGVNHAVWAILGACALHLIFLVDFAYYYGRALMAKGLAGCDLEIDGDCFV